MLFFSFFSSKNKNLFKSLNSLNYASYHLCKNLFRLTWESAVSYLRVPTVNITYYKSRRNLQTFNWENTLLKGDYYDMNIETSSYVK